MPRFYPAMKLHMGSWDYYTVKMDMSSLASEISFASDVCDEKTLDEHIQRDVGIKRAKDQIVSFLAKNNDRFFSSIVVAALNGNPQFTPIEVTDDPRFFMVADTVKDTFGMLMFDDSIKTYALDGQHRLFAIRELLENRHELNAPLNFEKETISVIFVVPRKDDTEESFRKSYRGLFSALNRHAKPTSTVTNIIMDEVDRFAIVTRGLIATNEFFYWDGVEGSPRVDVKSTSEAIRDSSAAIFTLIGLYKMNQNLLWDQSVLSEHGPYKANHKITQESLEDDELEDLQSYLDRIWDSLIRTLPSFHNEPAKMRVFGATGDSGQENNLLFRPLLQTNVLAQIARRLMDKAGITRDSSPQQIDAALAPLKHVPWDADHDFWRNFFTTCKPNGSWSMASDFRPLRIKCALAVLAWVVGIEDLTEEHLEEQRHEWFGLLGGTESEEREAVFDELEQIRNEILSI
jgi:DNA sulfur modification protein DndB